MNELPSKQERYFSGMPLNQDPNQPLPGEIPPGLRTKFIRMGVAVGLLGLGVVLGLAIAPEAPEESQERIRTLEQQLSRARARIAEANRALKYSGNENSPLEGMLSAKDRRRHLRRAKTYAASLRKVKAQSAADLVDWFIRRWNELLDRPEAEDRIQRRASVLSRLVGGMAKNIDPDDYVPWQAEFLVGDWLGEVHFDMDGDGFPRPRSGDNPMDGFTDTSVCQIAMALNQTVTNAKVLVMPGLRCDSPKAKLSVFLQGKTVDDALDEFVKSVRAEGLLAIEKEQRQPSSRSKIRLILVGPSR